MMECENPRIHNLAENELDLFKQLLIALDEVDLVSIHDLYVSYLCKSCNVNLFNLYYLLISKSLHIFPDFMFVSSLVKKL